MKNTTVFLFLLLVFGLIACEKEGPVGPTGPAGPAGPTGASGISIIKIDSFDIQPSQWVLIATGYYKYVYSTTSVTQQILNSGALNLYIKDYTYAVNYNAWYGMPDVVAGGVGWRYSFDLNTISIYADNFMNGIPRPYRFKAVIMK